MQAKARRSLGSWPRSSAPRTAIGFGGDGEQEPGAVDAGAEARLVVAEHDGDQRRVDEDGPQRRGCTTTAPRRRVHQPWMTAEALPRTLVAGDDGEEREALGVAGEVGDEQLGVERRGG